MQKRTFGKWLKVDGNQKILCIQAQPMPAIRVFISSVQTVTSITIGFSVGWYGPRSWRIPRKTVAFNRITNY